jgi:hypothetical protein
MFAPQDLPGRYGLVVRAIDHVLQILNCPSVVAGGWAVWHHGYFGRITQDLDIVLPQARIAEFLQSAAMAGFEVIPQPEGRWPKIRHKDTNVYIDVLPEGGRPGTVNRLAPTTIPHPERLGSKGSRLEYIRLPALIELKLAAGRPRDDADVTEICGRIPGRSIRFANTSPECTRRTSLGSTNCSNERATSGTIERARAR